MTGIANQILEMIATGEPVTRIFTALLRLVEGEAPGLLCSILLLDRDGVHVRHGCAPSLPPAYVASIDGTAIGPRAGSCGTAMYTARRVIVTDIAQDPLWNDHRSVALEHGLRACWSTPILSGRGKVLGSLAMYYHEARGPGQHELALIQLAERLVAIALERELAEAEAEEQRQEVVHLSRVAALGGLSGALAHELSQPLAGILSSAQAAQRVLAKRPVPLEELQEILEDIVASNRQAGTVVDHLRGMLMKRNLEFTPIDLDAVIDDALKLVRRDLAEKRIQLYRTSGRHLAPVMGDRVQIEQVLVNLIANACEAMSTIPEPDRTLSIRTSRASEATVSVSVSDCGLGIPADLEARVGEPFVTSKAKGLGLGLSISSSIARAHGGRLSGRNNPDRGATFCLTLPIVSSDAPPLAASAPAREAEPSS
jgi:signal transduction histidine kinase